MKANDGGFVVTMLNSLTTYAVSAIAHGATNDLVVLTVADMSGSSSAGVKVTYSSGSRPGDNGTVTDANGNYLATDSTGVSIVAWFVGGWSRSTITVTATDTTTTGNRSVIAPIVIPKATVTIPYGRTVVAPATETTTTAALSFGGSLGIKVGNAAHSVSIGNVNVGAGTASIRIQSDPIDLDLKVGESKQVDVDKDGIMDLEVKLEEVISATDVKVTIKKLEKAAVEVPQEPQKKIVDYTTGKWIKVLNNPIVYFIDKNNSRHIYLTQTIWGSYFGKDFSRVQIVPVTEMLNYPLGESVPFKSGNLIKTPSSPKVYKIDVDGTLQWIKDEAVATKLVGTNWAKQVVDIAEIIFGEYKLGKNLE